MNVPSDLKYTDQHEWASLADGVVTVGISDYAQDALGDIVFVDLPVEGATFEKGQELLAVESCKAAVSVYAPVTGTVVVVNRALADDPALVNTECYEGGWMVKLQAADPSQLDALMDAAAYENFLGTLEED
ncbi:MAG: glycine cleavage system protein GcvH [Planctomycetota bacterium]|jgi:glycine cleavage system H protein